MLSIHGDDLGLVLPFEVSPIQIVIIPILYKGKEKKVMEISRAVLNELKNFRVVLDDSEDRPGAKYYKWELKGVPIRIEIGPKEAEENSVVVSFRDERKKFKVSIDEINDDLIIQWAMEFKERIRDKAVGWMKEKVKYFDELNDLAEWVRNGVGLTHLCNNLDCGERIEEDVKGSVLGWFEELDWIYAEIDGECIICGGKGKLVAIAKTY